eukprot:TRINITY_DN9941_c2_g1_i1.p1 TRINITY_DN9941_c2_g1~~TRINITY_DN9941_c2_g1_i1.p1  ORF type:complete len:244 (+),score=89.30 TRINITY_DN9941_c2_g1_i1:111-842(+)
MDMSPSNMQSGEESDEEWQVIDHPQEVMKKRLGEVCGKLEAKKTIAEVLEVEVAQLLAASTADEEAEQLREVISLERTIQSLQVDISDDMQTLDRMDDFSEMEERQTETLQDLQALATKVGSAKSTLSKRKEELESNLMKEASKYDEGHDAADAASADAVAAEEDKEAAVSPEAAAATISVAASSASAAASSASAAASSSTAEAADDQDRTRPDGSSTIFGIASIAAVSLPVVAAAGVAMTTK